MIVGCRSHVGPSVPRQGVEVWRQGVEVWRQGVEVSMEDPRRNYSFTGVRLGRVFLADWHSAHSPWADQFDLIIRCCHKQGNYRRCHVSPNPHP